MRLQLGICSRDKHPSQGDLTKLEQNPGSGKHSRQGGLHSLAAETSQGWGSKVKPTSWKNKSLKKNLLSQEGFPIWESPPPHSPPLWILNIKAKFIPWETNIIFATFYSCIFLIRNFFHYNVQWTVPNSTWRKWEENLWLVVNQSSHTLDGSWAMVRQATFLQTWMMAEKSSLGPTLGTLNFSGCWDEELPASPTCLLSVVDLTETHHSSDQLRDRSAEYIWPKVMCELEYSRYANEVHKAVTMVTEQREET